MSETLEIIDADNVVHSLTDPASEIRVLRNPTGRFMPPFSILSTQGAGLDGNVFQEARAQAHNVNLPVLFKSASEIALRTSLRSAASWLNPLRGTYKIRSTAPDGIIREKSVIYAAGLEIDEGEGHAVNGWQKAVLTFQALDPFWQDQSFQSVPFPSGTASTFFPWGSGSAPFFTLSNSTIYADTTIDNDGDAEAYPVWTINGPGEGLILRNLTNGGLLSLSTILGTGESVTIDTTPGNAYVELSDGTNLFGDLTDRDLWALDPGVNTIRVEFANTTTDSSISLNYKRRYLTP